EQISAHIPTGLVTKEFLYEERYINIIKDRYLSISANQPDDPTDEFKPEKKITEYLLDIDRISQKAEEIAEKNYETTTFEVGRSREDEKETLMNLLNKSNVDYEYLSKNMTKSQIIELLEI